MISTLASARARRTPKARDDVERNPARLWILSCAVGCCLAGMFLGATILSTAVAGRSEDVAGDPDAHYVRQMAQDFGLTGRQQQSLRVVMQRYRDEQLQVFRHADFDQLPESLRAEMTAARRRQSERIRELLDDEQRRRFEDRSRTDGSAR